MNFPDNITIETGEKLGIGRSHANRVVGLGKTARAWQRNESTYFP